MSDNPEAEAAANRGGPHWSEAHPDDLKAAGYIPPRNPEDIEPLVALTRECIWADRKMTPEETKESWNDAYLTNIVVPILQHLLDYHRHHIIRYKEGLPSHIMDTRTMIDFAYSVVSLNQAIHVLNEWRG